MEMKRRSAFAGHHKEERVPSKPPMSLVPETREVRERAGEGDGYMRHSVDEDDGTFEGLMKSKCRGPEQNSQSDCHLVRVVGGRRLLKEAQIPGLAKDTCTLSLALYSSVGCCLGPYAPLTRCSATPPLH